MVNAFKFVNDFFFFTLQKKILRIFLFIIVLLEKDKREKDH